MSAAPVSTTDMPEGLNPFQQLAFLKKKKQEEDRAAALRAKLSPDGLIHHDLAITICKDLSDEHVRLILDDFKENSFYGRI